MLINNCHLTVQAGENFKDSGGRPTVSNYLENYDSDSHQVIIKKCLKTNIFLSFGALSFQESYIHIATKTVLLITNQNKLYKYIYSKEQKEILV